MNTDPNNPEALPSSDDAPSYVDPFEVSFLRHQAEFAAIEADQVLIIRLDLPRCIATALGVTKEVQPFREQLEQLPGFDIRYFNDLASYAQALSFANTLHLLASEPVEDITPLYERALALRETLNLDVRALVHRGLLDGKQIANLTGNVGYKNVATDLQILGVLLRTSWLDIEEKSAMTREEIDEAVTLAYRVLVAIGEKEQADANVNHAADMRARAYTVFLRAYDEVRRAITFLRWSEDDADDYVPTLWAGRGRKKGTTDIKPGPKTDEDDDGAVSPAGAAAPPASPSGNGADSSGPFVSS